jgi:hypothetical protein
MEPLWKVDTPKGKKRYTPTWSWAQRPYEIPTTLWKHYTHARVGTTVFADDIHKICELHPRARGHDGVCRRCGFFRYPTRAWARRGHSRGNYVTSDTPLARVDTTVYQIDKPKYWAETPRARGHDKAPQPKLGREVDDGCVLFEHIFHWPTCDDIRVNPHALGHLLKGL